LFFVIVQVNAENGDEIVVFKRGSVGADGGLNSGEIKFEVDELYTAVIIVEDKYDIDVEVLKVSHHGAINGTNEAFLDEVTPVVSVISSGNNSYGHPDSVVVGLLEDSGSLIYSTADDWNTWWINGSAGSDDVSLDDDVVVETDGNSIWVDSVLVWQNISVDEEFEGSLDIMIEPNPFQDTTQIKYTYKLLTDMNGTTQIKIFNAKGLLIREEKIENIKGKINEVVWDGKDENGNSVSAGVYFYYQNT